MNLQEELRLTFRPGVKYTNKQIKSTLKYLYEIHGVKSKAKAQDLKLFGFNVKRAIIRDENRKRVEGLLILP